jgi:hypothetical protein
MSADETQHHHFVRLSAAVSADRTQMNRRINFVLWFFNRLQFRADNQKIPAQQQALDVRRNSKLTISFSQTVKKPPLVLQQWRNQ